MYCDSCKNFGHYLEKCPLFFESMKDYSLPSDIMAKVRYGDIKQRWHDSNNINRTCVFCRKWIGGNDGLDRFMVLQGSFIIDKEVWEEEDIDTVFICTKCNNRIEDELGDEIDQDKNHIWFSDKGRFFIHSAFSS